MLVNSIRRTTPYHSICINSIYFKVQTSMILWSSPHSWPTVDSRFKHQSVDPQHDYRCYLKMLSLTQLLFTVIPISCADKSPHFTAAAAAAKHDHMPRFLFHLYPLSVPFCPIRFNLPYLCGNYFRNILLPISYRYSLPTFIHYR